MPHIQFETLSFSSLFLTVVGPADIEAERQKIEAEQGRPVKVHSADITTRSGVPCTRVTWEVC